MILNKFWVDGKKNVIYANASIVCHCCAVKHAEEKKAPLEVAYRELRGKLIGKKVKVFPTLRDNHGPTIYLCGDCVKEIEAELSDAAE